MDRFWLLTWTTYGSWLPGDRRGSVARLRNASGKRVARNIPGTPPAPPTPDLERYVRARMAAPAVRLSPPQAATVLDEFRDTARRRGWTLFAVAVMANHVHIVVGVSGDPQPSRLLREFKGWASHGLNRARKEPGRWWTSSGSTRKLDGEAHVIAAIAYVRNQQYPLIVWAPEFGQATE